MAKQISINQWEKLLEDRTVNIPLDEKDPEGTQIEIHTTLPFGDVISFISDVVELSFAEDTGEYLPEVYDYLIRRGIIAYYTNLRLPKDMDKQYELLLYTNVFGRVFDQINKDQFQQILVAIDKKIDNIKASQLSLAKTVRNSLGMILEAVGGLSELDPEKVNEAVESLKTISEGGSDAIAQALKEAASKDTEGTEDDAGEPSEQAYSKKDNIVYLK